MADKFSIKKIWCTEDAEKLIAYIARVSNPLHQDNPSYEKLLTYLVKHKHWSPFEMANLCVEVKTTRGIAAQILRHRSFSFQEFSQRYAKVTESPCMIQLRSPDPKNRQNSIDDIPEEKQKELQILVKEAEDKAYETYNALIENGVAKECARFVLPLSSPTTLYMNGNLRSWIHYIQLRSANGTQKEHADIAQAVFNQIFQVEFPTIAKIMT